MVTVSPWLGEQRGAWLAEVGGWAQEAVPAVERGVVTGFESIKERPWSAVLRVVTSTGRLYFKAPGSVGRHEPTVIAHVSAGWPRLAPDLLAVEPTRGWMLLADHGTPISDVLDPAAQVEVIERLLPSYAEMQASTMTDVRSWIAAGAPDRRVHRLPELLDSLLGGQSPIGALLIDAEERAALVSGATRFEMVCGELAATPTPHALDHADLHGTNVLVRAGHHPRLVDWGDSCVSHPFSTVFVPYELVVRTLPGHRRRLAAIRLRDVYLEPWGAGPEQRELFGLAVWVAHVTRAVNIAHESPGHAGDHAEILALLRQWNRKRDLLQRPDDVIQPL